MAERVSIYIDGGNFYHLTLKKMGLEEIDFNYEKFADFLADGTNGRPSLFSSYN